MTTYTGANKTPFPDKTLVELLDEAVNENDINTVKSLIQDVDRPDELIRLSRSLYKASSKNYIKIVELLLDAGVDPNITFYNAGWTPLYIAALTGHSKIVELLLVAGANPNVKDTSNRTPLFEATLNNHLVAVVFLLKAGAKPNIQDEEGRTALYMASSFNYIQIASILLAYGADPNISDKNNKNSIDVATEHNNNIIVSILNDALAKADIIEPNTQLGLDIDSLQNNPKILDILNNWRYKDPNKLTENRRNIFMETIINGYDYAFEDMLPRVTNINAVDKDGNTALHYAVIFYRKGMIFDLLKHKDIDLTIKNKNGKMAYDYALDFKAKDNSYVKLLEEPWKQQMEAKLAPGGLEFRLASYQFHIREDPKFLHRDPHELSDENLMDLARIFVIIGKWESRDELIDDILKIQMQMKKYFKKNPRSSDEDFLKTLEDPETYTFEEIFDMSDETIEEYLEWYNVNSTGNRWDDIYFIAEQLYEEGSIDEDYEHLYSLYLERSYPDDIE